MINQLLFQSIIDLHDNTDILFRKFLYNFNNNMHTNI